MSGAHFAKLLHEHVAERERFEAVKGQVQIEAAKNEQIAKEQAMRVKMRRREDAAFRLHIAKERESRGLESTSSLVSLLGPAESQADSDRTETQLGFDRTEEVAQDDVTASQYISEASQYNIYISEESLNSNESVFQRTSVVTDDGGSRPPSKRQSALETKLAQAHASARLSTLQRFKTRSRETSTLKLEPTGEEVEGHIDQSRRSSFADSDEEEPTTTAKVMHVRDSIENRRKSKLSTLTTSEANAGKRDSQTMQQLFFKKMNDFSNQATIQTKAEHMDAAIADHADARQKAILKGRVLRMLHSDVQTSLSRKDLHELELQLPRLPQCSDNSTRADMLSHTGHAARKELATKAAPGMPPHRSMTKAAAYLLHRKCRELVGQQFGAVIPIAP
jgi:hypothetical protein